MLLTPQQLESRYQRNVQQIMLAIVEAKLDARCVGQTVSIDQMLTDAKQLFSDLYPDLSKE